MFQSKGRGVLVRGLVSALLVALLISCGPSKRKSKIVKECILPEEQYGTMLGHWKKTPIPVRLQASSSFSQQEKDAIAAAAQSWNDFFGVSKSLQIFDLPGTAQDSTKPADFCSSSVPEFVQNGAFVQEVVIYKVANGWSVGDGTIALTSVCSAVVSGGDSFKTILRAGMQLNYQYYFASGKVPDLQSIALHELGHLLGLGHSCETGGGSGVPDCSSGSIKSDYTFATMFPTFQFPDGVNGEQKRELQANDMGRANCLY